MFEAETATTPRLLPLTLTDIPKAGSELESSSFGTMAENAVSSTLADPRTERKLTKGYDPSYCRTVPIPLRGSKKGGSLSRKKPLPSSGFTNTWKPLMKAMG